MIEFRKGDIFQSGAEALVNPVNTMGVSGKGLAREFRKRYPGMFSRYQAACDMGAIEVGHVYVHVESTPCIVCFPTKEDWRKPSEYPWIRAGAHRLYQSIVWWGWESVAIPALGCGLGGLR